MEYIIYFAKAVKLFQQKNRGCFRCGSPDHLMWDYLKDISKNAWKVGLNTKEGASKNRGQAPQKLAATQQTSLEESPKHKDIAKDSLPESRPLTHWSGPKT